MFRRAGKLSVLSGKDDRVKIINERINLTEKHFAELCNAFRNVAQRLAKQRDAYDELAKCLKAYGDDEEISESLQECLRTYANAITILADYMDINVNRLETKLVNELSQYENLTKSARENLRSAVIARDKEVLKQRQMLEIKTKFAANNSAADSELFKAKLEVNRTNKEIDGLSASFEQRKLQDIKTLLLDFILINMKHHTKALEVLSASYNDVCNMDEESDLFQLHNVLQSKQPQITNKRDLRSQSMESLDREQLLSPLQRSAKLSKSKPSLTTTQSEQEDEDEEDDDDDEEDEEEEEDENEDTEAEYEEESEDSQTDTTDNEASASNLPAQKQKDVIAEKTMQGKPKTQLRKHAKPQAARRTVFEARSVTALKRDAIAGSLSKDNVASASSRLVTLVESKKK